MTTVDIETPAAPDDEIEQPPTDAGESLPPSDQGESSAPAAVEDNDTIKELRDRLAQSGRVITELRTQNGTLAGQIAATNQRLEAIGAQLSEKEKREQAAYLASLPADEREKEEFRLNNQRLEARLSALEREKTVPQPTEAEQQQATIRLAHQMAVEASEDFGLDEGEQVAWNDPRLAAAGAWESPESYKREVRRLARKVANGTEPAQPQPQGATAVAANPHQKKGAATPPPNQPTDIAKIAAEAAKAAVAEALGTVGGAPNSARPAAIVPERSPDEQAYQSTLRSYDPRQGPKATRAALREQLTRAEAAAAKAGRV